MTWNGGKTRLKRRNSWKSARTFSSEPVPQHAQSPAAVLGKVPPLLPSHPSPPRSPPNGIWGFHLGAHGVLSFTTRNVHYDFGELVQIAGSLCHVPNINLRKPGCKAVQIQTETLHPFRFDHLAEYNQFCDLVCKNIIHLEGVRCRGCGSIRTMSGSSSGE
jgi:hypothetical protein